MDSKFNRLKEICDNTAKSLSLDIAKDVPEEVAGKLAELVNLLSVSAHAVALAEYLYAEKIAQLTEDLQYSKLSATDKKMIFGGRAKNEIYYVTLTERQNRSIVHAIDALRSILSFMKQEMSNLPTK